MGISLLATESKISLMNIQYLLTPRRLIQVDNLGISQKRNRHAQPPPHAAAIAATAHACCFCQLHACQQLIRLLQHLQQHIAAAATASQACQL